MKNFYNRRNLRTYCSEVFVLLVSAFIYSLAFPGFVTSRGWGFVAFFALIPVLAVIRNTSVFASALYGFVFGVSFYLCFNYWLPGFHKLAILIVTVIKGTEMVFLFLSLKAADRFFRRFSYIVQAIIWVAYAYLAESWFAGYPYGNIGYSLYRYLPLMQIAEFTGVWGIIFLMILPQAFLARYVADLFRGSDPSFVSYLRKNRVFPVVYILIFILWLTFGLARCAKWSSEEPDRYWRVAAIQHNHDSWKGGLETYRSNFSNLRRLSLEAIRRDPEVVVWSETAFVPSVDWHMSYSYEETDKIMSNKKTAKLVKEFVEFGEELGLPLVTGNPRGVLKDPSKGPVLEDGTLNRMDYNTVILFDEGRIKQSYAKQHLVPFTEHFPYEKQLPWMYRMLLANDYNWWLPGDEAVVFEASGVKFSTPICYEDTFGYHTAEFVENGAEVILNLTNDRWSGCAEAAVQHAAIAVLRSVETRKSMVRSTNSGLTCMILPTGRIVDPVEQFKQTWHIYDVPVYSSERPDTFYVKHPDLLAHIAVYLSAILLAVGLVLAIVRSAGRKKEVR